MLLFVGLEVGVVEREPPERGEFAFDAIQPGCRSRREVKSHAMAARPLAHAGVAVRPVVVQDDVQRFPRRVEPTQPLQERQELRRGLVIRKAADQRASRSKSYAEKK